MLSIDEIIKDCTSYSSAQNWFIFANSTNDIDEIGKAISALSNAIVLSGRNEGYLIWGIDEETYEYTNTTFDYHSIVEQETLEHFLSSNLHPHIDLRFEETVIDGHRIVLLHIPAPYIVPTSYKDVRYLFSDSTILDLSKLSYREIELFRVLGDGLPNLINTESQYSDMSFDQLFLYSKMKGIKLNSRTFKKKLHLLTSEGKYNLPAQFLSDNSQIPIRFAVFKGKTKASTMYTVREFGFICLLLSLEKILDFGDIMNIPQADERNRIVERKEVMLFDGEAFTAAVITALLYNTWTESTIPMFTAYEDRIEILSFGTLQGEQTIDSFLSGKSVPVNTELADIFRQLHITDNYGGVPRIVQAYGREAFSFRNNAIVITIPFNRLDLNGEI